MNANVNSIVQHVIQINSGIMILVNASAKSIVSAKKDYSWNRSTCICENGKYLKSVAHTLLIVCDEMLYVMDIVSTNVLLLYQQMSRVLCQQIFTKK